MDDPIASGETPPDDTPDKRGRTGKSKGGRPSKAQKAREEREEREREERERRERAEHVAADLEGVCRLVFGIIASRLGSHWNLEDEEAQRLAYRFARVEMKWGGLLDRYGEEVMLIGCLAAISYPRIMTTLAESEGKPVDAEDVTGRTGDSGAGASAQRPGNPAGP